MNLFVTEAPILSAVVFFLFYDKSLQKVHVISPHDVPGAGALFVALTVKTYIDIETKTFWISFFSSPLSYCEIGFYDYGLSDSHRRTI